MHIQVCEASLYQLLHVVSPSISETGWTTWFAIPETTVFQYVVSTLVVTLIRLMLTLCMCKTAGVFC